MPFRLGPRPFTTPLSRAGPGTLSRLLYAVLRSCWLVWRLRPDVVVGTGGYISLPTCVAAWLLRKTLVVQEQNAHAGVANRLLGRLAATVFLAFPQAAAAFPKAPRCAPPGPRASDLVSIRLHLTCSASLLSIIPTHSTTAAAVESASVAPLLPHSAVFGGARTTYSPTCLQREYRAGGPVPTRPAARLAPPQWVATSRRKAAPLADVTRNLTEGTHSRATERRTSSRCIDPTRVFCTPTAYRHPLHRPTFSLSGILLRAAGWRDGAG